MSLATQQQPSLDWDGSDEKFPEVLSNPLPDVHVQQLHLNTLPRKGAGSTPLLIILEDKTAPVEDRVTVVVPYNPFFKPFGWGFLPPLYFPALVNWSPLRLFQQNAASLNVKREIFLACVVWDHVITVTNLQNTATTDTSQVSIGLTVRNGEEASKVVQERDSFVGLTVKYGHSEHTFSEEETQEPHQVTIQYTVPAKTTVYGYQRKYKFIYNLWFDVNTDSVGHSVGPDGNPTRASIGTSIQTEETLFTEKKLDHRVAGVPVETVDPPSGLGDYLIDVKTISGIVEGIVESAKQPVKA